VFKCVTFTVLFHHMNRPLIVMRFFLFSVLILNRLLFRESYWYVKVQNKV